MPTPAERRALLFVAAVAALGVVVRGFGALSSNAAPADSRSALASQLASVDSALSSGGRSRSRSPRASPQRTEPAARRQDVERISAGAARSAAPSAGAAGLVDVDRASEAELDALPGIGPALAKRIVENRFAEGGFGSLDALQDVRGIGPALAAKIAPFVTFSAPPRPPRAAGPVPGRSARSSHP